ncbi:hypothetical protein [Cesiribacter sp. SM1]|uniref:hypothetical protein n=1 Tax=Cesiribacter sp. SM1 TaxID=2861196 RepID=UPI001CD2213A|nr:hypothetical protein [Cesiribacter sp. SM1]
MPRAHHFIVNLPVQDSAAVAGFFENLGFTELYPPLIANTRLYSDGYLQVQLSPAEADWRTGIVFCTEQPIDSHAAALQLSGIQTVVQDNKIRVVAPDGTAVYWLSLKDFDFPKQPATGHSLCGSFYEISLEVNNLEENRIFWESVGFKKILPEGDISSWLTMSHPLLRVGLYEKGSCGHPFRSPALTWFNANAAEKLSLLQQKGFKLAHILPAATAEPEEAILESPEGHHLFLFKAW